MDGCAVPTNHLPDPMPLAQVLIVIPVHNEAAALPGVIQELRLLPEVDVLIVDDASTDDSAALAQQQDIPVLPLCIKLGAWGAMQAGLRYAHKHGYQQVVTMDGDGQHHSLEVRSLVAAMEGNPKADVVIGACTHRGSKLRHMAWKFFRLLTGFNFQDITSGFRLYNRRAIEKLIGSEATLLEYQDVGVLLLLKDAGLSIIEKEVDMTPRKHGKSRIYSSWLMVAYYMVVTTVLSLSKIKRLPASA